MNILENEGCYSRQRKPRNRSSEMGRYKEYLWERISISLFGMHGSSKKVGGLIQVAEGGLISSKED